MKQIIIIRKDLKMRRGKEIAQGSHASSKFLLNLLLSGKKLSDAQISWVNQGMKKVCVQVNSEQELLDLWEKARDHGLISSLIQDSGLTEFDGVPTYTALAIGPDEDDVINMVTGNLQLY